MKKLLVLLYFFISLMMLGCAGQMRPLGEFIQALKSRVDEGDASDRLSLHRLRNAGAMADLIGRLETRPSRITYLASGSHLAPLILCELLPQGKTCDILMTEIDAGVQQGISQELKLLEDARCLKDLHSTTAVSSAAGERTWTFQMMEHAVKVKLLVSDPASVGSRVIRPEFVRGRDLIISHDWSGDPLGNLQLIRAFLGVAETIGSPPPLLMIENLEAHPYPIDMEFFGPVARTPLSYGHRDADEGLGRHGHIELGPPIFGGALLLGFSPEWWRGLSGESLDAFFDFLLLNQFDLDRQNVISGGENPVLAPEILDWFTGFGARDIQAHPIRPGSGFRLEMLKQVAELKERMNPELQERLGCRMALYESLMELRASGVETLSLMPSARMKTRPTPGHFPDERMEALYRQSLRKINQFREERSELKAIGEGILVQMRENQQLQRLLSRCPGENAERSSSEQWKARYSQLDAQLSTTG